MTMPAAAVSGVRVGLWGAAVSGKTSFIASLDIAARRFQERFPSSQLRVTAGGSDSEEAHALFLSYQNDLSRGKFPQPTAKTASFALQVTGDVPQSVFGVGARANGSLVPISLTISMRDFPGKAFQIERDATFADVGEFLAGCQGVLLLFDPVREAAGGDNSHFIHRPLSELDARMRALDKLVSTGHASYRLPQWLAICVTKFDHPLVYERLRSAVPSDQLDSIIAYGSETLPEALQRELGLSEFVASASRFFLPERVRFFLTSTIGLYCRPDHSLPDVLDYVNTVETYGGVRVRGQCRPINVIEPLLWLNEHTRG